jgi:hypothetical protein
VFPLRVAPEISQSSLNKTLTLPEYLLPLLIHENRGAVVSGIVVTEKSAETSPMLSVPFLIE